MRIALDPYMHRHLSLEELPRKVAELGYEWIELSPRDDLLVWWVAPRAYPERIQSFKKALKQNGVKIASLLPMYRWATPYEDERRTATTTDERRAATREKEGPASERRPPVVPLGVLRSRSVGSCRDSSAGSPGTVIIAPQRDATAAAGRPRGPRRG